MTPTPEQVAVWAQEAGAHVKYEISYFTTDELHRLVTRAMAEQAEADAKLCDAMYTPTSTAERIANELSAAIRANAPKVTT